MDIKYRTPFQLTADVLCLESARQYLTEDDMTRYLQDDLDDSCTYFTIPMSHLKDKIRHIEWHLVTENRGYIELITTEEIPQVELDQISEWVSGQCSDGLGEVFEQQDFASYEDENWCGNRYDEEDCEDMWITASFDWKTNKYLFSRFNN